MKTVKFLNLFASVVILSLAVVGCKKNPYGVTPLPRSKFGHPGEDVPPGPVTAPIPVTTTTTTPNGDGTIATANFGDFANYIPDASILSAQTVHFDLDSATVKSSEQSKIEAVADYMKKNPTHALKIEGHCDERGTEEYNRSLGERRALALREYLANLGCNPAHILTVSFGKDQPVDTGHDEAAWSKNRRGVFVVLTPPK